MGSAISGGDFRGDLDEEGGGGSRDELEAGGSGQALPS